MKELGNFHPGVTKLPDEVYPGDVVCTIFRPDMILGIILDKKFIEALDGYQSPYPVEICSVLRTNGQLMETVRTSYLQQYKEKDNE